MLIRDFFFFLGGGGGGGGVMDGNGMWYIHSATVLLFNHIILYITCNLYYRGAQIKPCSGK